MSLHTKNMSFIFTVILFSVHLFSSSPLSVSISLICHVELDCRSTQGLIRLEKDRRSAGHSLRETPRPRPTKVIVTEVEVSMNFENEKRVPICFQLPGLILFIVSWIGLDTLFRRENVFVFVFISSRWSTPFWTELLHTKHGLEYSEIWNIIWLGIHNFMILYGAWFGTTWKWVSKSLGELFLQSTHNPEDWSTNQRRFFYHGKRNHGRSFIVTAHCH